MKNLPTLFGFGNKILPSGEERLVLIQNSRILLHWASTSAKMDEQSAMQHMPMHYRATPYPNAQLQPNIAHGAFQQPSIHGHPHALSSHHNQLPYQQQIHQHQRQLHHHQQQQIEVFWANQMQEIEQAVDFRNHSLPLARIKKIMKSDDENVRMISAEAPVVFAKACEMFINELTLRAWIHTEENKRRTLQKNDIAAAIARTDIFDFLIDIVPRDELKEDQVINLGNPRSVLSVGSSSTNAAAATAANSFPYYYLPNQHSVPHGVFVGKPMDPTIYMQQPQSPVAYMPNIWQWGHVQADQSRSPNPAS